MIIVPILATSQIFSLKCWENVLVIELRSERVILYELVLFVSSG